jgi:hypothetical protein
MDALTGHDTLLKTGPCKPFASREPSLSGVFWNHRPPAHRIMSTSRTLSSPAAAAATASLAGARVGTGAGAAAGGASPAVAAGAAPPPCRPAAVGAPAATLARVGAAPFLARRSSKCAARSWGGG